MKILLLTLSLLWLTGCASIPGSTQEVKVVVPVKCSVDPIEPPIEYGSTITELDDLFVKIKKLIAEIEQRRAYEIKLKAALDSCTK
jgi:hypothetical protein